LRSPTFIRHPAELARTIALPATVSQDLPRGFVRLVYCIGYGENELLNRVVEFPRNGGTPQFWKILYSCANAITTNGDVAPIQSSMTTREERVANKVALLRRLRELGVWLLDTSPAALYFRGGPKPRQSILDACLQVGWDYHVRHAIENAAPTHIVCVGRGVARALGSRLSRVGALVTVVPQPNARLSSADHHESFRTYYRVVREANRLATAT